MLRSVRRQTYALDSAIGKGIVWGYQSSTASVVYSNDVGAILEDAYMRNLKMVHLGMTTLNVPFTVYIDKMTQSNNFSGEEFKVLRDVMLDKYTLDKIPQSSAKAPPIRRAKSYASPMVRGRPSQARPTPTASFVTGAAVSLPGQAQRVSPLLFGGGSSQYGQPTPSNAAHQPYFIPSPTSNSVSSARFTAPSSFKKPVSASPSFPMSTAAVKFPNRSLTRQPTSAVPKSGSVTNDRGFVSWISIQSWCFCFYFLTFSHSTRFRDEAKHLSGEYSHLICSPSAFSLSALEIVAQFVDSAVPSEGVRIKNKSRSISRAFPIAYRVHDFNVTGVPYLLRWPQVRLRVLWGCKRRPPSRDTTEEVQTHVPHGLHGGHVRKQRQSQCPYDCIWPLTPVFQQNGCLQCPTCKTIYGMKTGICPRGRMYYEKKSFPLPGHSDCGCIEITYHIVPGTQVGAAPLASRCTSLLAGTWASEPWQTVQNSRIPS